MLVAFIHRFRSRNYIGHAPLGLLYLAAALRKAGHDVCLIDGVSIRRAVREACRLRPRIAGFSCGTGFQQHDLSLATALKNALPETLVVFGGPHATFFPDLVRKTPVDAVCRGEGEESFVEFAERVAANAEYWLTPGFRAKRDGRVFSNSLAPLVADLDSIPFPDRDLLSRWPANGSLSIRSFITSRGCPFDCAYCFNHVLHEMYPEQGRRVRRRSVDNVIAEIDLERKKRPFGWAFFVDDMFIGQRRWMEEFAVKYRRAGGPPFICNARPESVDDDTARLLAEAGCRVMYIGIESGVETYRRERMGREMSDARITEAAHTLGRHDITPIVEVMIGLPDSDISDDTKTLDLAIESAPGYADCSVFLPLPMTRLGDLALEKRLFSGDYDGLGDFFKTTYLDLPHKKEITNLQQVFNLVATHPRLRPALPWMLKFPVPALLTPVRVFGKAWAFFFRITPVPILDLATLDAVRLYVSGR